MTWKHIEKHALTTIVTDLVGICIFITAAACLQRLSAVKPENLIVYPNYLFPFFLDLISPSLGIILVISFSFRNKGFRKYFEANLKAIFLKLQVNA